MPQTNTNNIILGTHPVEIYIALDNYFGENQWLAWEPETILLSLADNLSSLETDKLLAVHAVASNTSLVLRDSNAFEKVVHAFCNNPCVMDVNQPPYIEEILYTVRQIRKIARLVHGDKAKDMVFSDEVPAYVGAVAKYRGWIALPSEIEWGEPTLNRLTGLDATSKLRKEHEKVVDYVDGLYHTLKTTDAEELLKDEGLSSIEEDDTGGVILKKIIGALLYDPTLLYQKHEDGDDN